MSWAQQDNRHYRGHMDRINVSRTEDWEVNYFIDHYLKTRSYGLTDENRRIVGQAMEAYQGRVPVKRDDLSAFLDGKFGKS